jgi:toxin YoeB
MSADDYDSWQETVYLLRSPENARRLMEAVARDKAGHSALTKSIDELREMAGGRKTTRRVTRLIAEIQRNPFSGIGKPEPLKGELSGYWSRRINDEHRLVYRAGDDEVKILKARHRY